MYIGFNMSRLYYAYVIESQYTTDQAETWNVLISWLWLTACSAWTHTWYKREMQSRVPTLLVTKNTGLFHDPRKNFPGLFCSPQMFKYNALAQQF